MLEAALIKPDEVTTVAALAKVLGLARGTVFNRCRQAWGIRPEELLMWARLALAAHFLAYTGCTVEAIAYQLGFASDNALRNSMKRYSGLRATDVRAAGGVGCLGRALRKRVATA
jgi:AraC-like DNA-binding protein